jgi:hypothetical protein
MCLCACICVQTCVFVCLRVCVCVCVLACVCVCVYSNASGCVGCVLGVFVAATDQGVSASMFCVFMQGARKSSNLQSGQALMLYNSIHTHAHVHTHTRAHTHTHTHTYTHCSFLSGKLPWVTSFLRSCGKNKENRDWMCCRCECYFLLDYFFLNLSIHANCEYLFLGNQVSRYNFVIAEGGESLYICIFSSGDENVRAERTHPFIFWHNCLLCPIRNYTLGVFLLSAEARVTSVFPLHLRHVMSFHYT